MTDLNQAKLVAVTKKDHDDKWCLVEEEGIFQCASEYTPVSWWELYGAEMKELQEIR